MDASAVADRVVLERVLSEGAVARTMPEVEWTSYFYHLLRKLTEAILSLVMGGVTRLLEAEGFWRIAVWGVLALAAVALLVWLGRFALRWWQRRRRGAASAGREEGAAAAESVEDRYALEARAWRSLLEEHLKAGRIPQALEAVWWWLARALAADRVDPSWTSRELVERAGRRELRPTVGALDALIYGPRRPTTEQVRRLVSALEAHLPREAGF